ncbi:molybdate ABC transporter substrate-binding protein [Vibrio ponticus]|uniref:Molybdate ABC transporter substrate-binding protein n=1 Tax=Vibrio ponticus TaxID=265668 RepID=A0ABX3F4K6_9VIBR|nr:molybdate ABC transporter substrate-binding protein [Vibrio ponticus]OLQ84870.1 molybdate ABC transporter substrate-binding protein [Vibrio ponticus]
MLKITTTPLLISLLAGSALFSTTVHADDNATIRVYAASSLTNVLNQLISDYENTHSVDIVPIYGGSSSLARQIERGAPADMFISANEQWVTHLEKQGVANKQNIYDFTHNQLVVIAPQQSEIALNITEPKSWLSAIGDSRLAIGQPNAVPAGIYAKQSLQSLNLWQSLSKHLAPTKNVRVALTLVERAEAPLGIVYKSDAVVSSKVQVIHTFAASSHDPIRYPMVTITDSADVAQFTQYLMSEPAKQALSRFGFD